MIRIVNWLLTRKCNLNCDYCAIIRDYKNMPYHDMNYYYKNEMSTEVVINALNNFKKHNQDVFNIFYGGEPLLRKDLPQIINHCNENDIQYTIISNNTPEIQPLIKRQFNETNYIQGFTSSVDPVINDERKSGSDRIRKSIEGLLRLKEIQSKGNVKDVVAEITVMNNTQELLYDLVSELSQNDIYSDITFVDISKSSYYDFSNIHDRDILVNPSWKLANIFRKMIDEDDLLIHMKDILLPKMFDTLPSNFDCKLEESIHNVSVDADGSMRLCLRIKGQVCPTVHVRDLFEDPQCHLITKDFYELMCIDKKRLCYFCNHSCLMMSKYISDTGKGQEDLVHIDKREG